MLPLQLCHKGLGIALEAIHHTEPAAVQLHDAPGDGKPQAAAMSAIIRSIPGTFAVCSQVSEVMGNFKRLDNRAKPELQLLDQGDGIGIS